MKATGTKILIVRAKRRTDRNGVIIPDSAQPDSAYGLVMSVGPGVLSAGWKGKVVLFNPHQAFGSGFEDRKGQVLIEAIDEEVVLGVITVASAIEVFGVELPEIPADLLTLFGDEPPADPIKDPAGYARQGIEHDWANRQKVLGAGPKE